MKHLSSSSGPRRRPTSRAVPASADAHKINFALGLFMLAALAMVVLITTTARAADAQDALGQLPSQPGYAFLDQALPVSHTLAGNYLAGRYAQRRQDWSAAETYIGEVARRDGANAAMTHRAFLLALGAGRYQQAEKLVVGIDNADPVADVAHIFQAAMALRENEPVAALGHLESLPAEGFSDFTRPLLVAWTLAANGKFDAAQAALATADSKGVEGIIAFHRGLIAEMAADDTTAAAAYVTSMREGLSLHGALVIAHYFDRNGAHVISEKIYEGVDRLFAGVPTLRTHGDNIYAKQNLTAADGAAFAIFDIASMLYERRAYDSAQIYASLAQLLSPNMPYARLMLGDIAALGGHYDDALAHYQAIAETSPLFWLSRLRVAEVYQADGDIIAATNVLEKLAEQPQTQLPSLVALGDIHRRQLDFAKARDAYDRALATSPADEVRAPILFSRGMSLTRLGDWPAAEKDLTAALAIDPNNADILNFLGYSMIDRQQNTDAAFEYIRRAVALEPQDGYILDSYGWALFRRQDFSGAIDWLEKAVAAVPGDATILDHLGDAYWQVGRYTEAQYQWRRARDLTGDAALRGAVDAKLLNGLNVPAPSQMVRHDDAKI